jgi:hypothetical protein
MPKMKSNEPLAKTSSKVKRRYNKGTYQNYIAYIRAESMLSAILEREKKAGNSISDIIKNALCKHYDISRADGDITYSDYYIDAQGNTAQRRELDKYAPPEPINNDYVNNILLKKKPSL